jgi:hypothetical protein
VNVAVTGGVLLMPDSWQDGGAFEPATVTATTCGAPGALSSMTMAAVPPEPVGGVIETLTVQLAPGARLAAPVVESSHPES